MIAAPFHLGGERLMLDPAGALFWPARRTLVVADLHLEKASAYAARGQLLPPYDTRDTLERLAPILRRYRPARLVALGDSFHDRDGHARLPGPDRALLLRLLDGMETVWVLGNHDPVPPDLPGTATENFAEGPLVFRHQGGGDGHELSGHFHPKATVPTRGGPVCRPCFVASPQRVLLPAFGSLTGGLDARDAAIAALFPRGARLFLLGRERLHSVPLAALPRPRALVPDSVPLQQFGGAGGPPAAAGLPAAVRATAASRRP
ncbi:ligase-associated DNA damage response endonuclease PdeM [Roseomonas sp. NAR14]|uniref:Ligase-associated DNA damage response endonuclease PdeM n=1 Tax=Roseomonas acroporae TaxID=2937791 RepID=A0A9X1Y7R5_9PROT|nr:ligase-associated DNA damage response endonuclease PdeM [Roseomonas acroporae]MCK8785103.1 ligase-associated DNA damage response endonuclease PdeM [Roseomonas acroporae]